MTNQFCKVGSCLPLDHSDDTLATIRLRYAEFLDRAAQAAGFDVNQLDFLQGKIRTFSSVLIENR